MHSIEKILTLYPLLPMTDILKPNGYRRLDLKHVVVHVPIRVNRRLIAQLWAQAGAKIIRCITIQMRTLSQKFVKNSMSPSSRQKKKSDNKRGFYLLNTSDVGSKLPVSYPRSEALKLAISRWTRLLISHLWTFKIWLQQWEQARQE